MTSNKPVAIIGAGIAGLTAANFLRRRGVPITLYEAGPKIAGLAQSYSDKDGFSYDFGAHFVTNRLAVLAHVELHEPMYTMYRLFTEALHRDSDSLNNPISDGAIKKVNSQPSVSENLPFLRDAVGFTPLGRKDN